MAPRKCYMSYHLSIKRLRRPAWCCMLLLLRSPLSSWTLRILLVPARGYNWHRGCFPWGSCQVQNRKKKNYYNRHMVLNQVNLTLEDIVFQAWKLKKKKFYLFFSFSSHSWRQLTQLCPQVCHRYRWERRIWFSLLSEWLMKGSDRVKVSTVLWGGSVLHSGVISPCGVPSPHASPCPGQCQNTTILQGCLPNFFTTQKHFSNGGRLK